jgi:hypothetical protein
MTGKHRALHTAAGPVIGGRTGKHMVKIISVLLVVSSIAVIFASCDLFGDDEADVIVPGGQSWSGRNWVITFDEAIWSGCKLSVDVSITNTGDIVATFGSIGEGETGKLYVVDKYSQTFDPDKLFPWEKQFYEEKFYPDETRSGTLEYDIDARSEHVWMMMSPNYPEVTQLSFDLGDVPDFCE